METLLGIPLIGWKAISIWLVVILVPWTYSLYFIWKINRSGVERWGAKPAKIKEKELSQ
ncbi:hypothetical protein [Bacillus dakarensis]|uniref:hypothetical protein n=1 Tax=Robertmurraya dakarensis TaxID=1926278 RepID=UPI0012B683FC|nr:hypothetical protein [Bacillus dakarensis]